MQRREPPQKSYSGDSPGISPRKRIGEDASSEAYAAPARELAREDDPPEGGKSPLVAQSGLKHPPWRPAPSGGIRFDPQSVVHGNPQLLLASEVAFRGLDGDLAELKLDLVKFAAREYPAPGHRCQSAKGAALIIASLRSPAAPSPPSLAVGHTSSRRNADRPRQRRATGQARTRDKGRA
jgi:hypothetical protein